MTSKDAIIQRMLARVDPKYDTSVGSFFYDAVAPMAVELEQVYLEQAQLLDQYLVDTATGDNLTRKAAELGVIRKPAVRATTTVTITGSTGAVIAIGDQVASETSVYRTTLGATVGPSGQVSVPVQAEVAGAGANVPVGAIRFFPVTLPGLAAVTNAQAVIDGVDEESDEALRERYLERVQQPATSGNAAHYRQWAKEIAGIGDAKVFPLWSGPGTVRVVVVNTSMQPPTAGLVAAVAAHIEAMRPIGATVTVAAASSVAINVSASVVLAAGYTQAQVRAALEAALDSYLQAIAFVETLVRYNYIAALLLDVAGVVDFSGLTLNGGTANVALGADQVPARGVVTIV